MRILCIGDTQVKPGIDLGYLDRVGKYLVEKEPDIVVHLGDHWDLPSLSSYDVGKKSFEGRRYVEAPTNTMRNILVHKETNILKGC